MSYSTPSSNLFMLPGTMVQVQYRRHDVRRRLTHLCTEKNQRFISSRNEVPRECSNRSMLFCFWAASWSRTRDCCLKPSEHFAVDTNVAHGILVKLQAMPRACEGISYRIYHHE